MDYNQEQFFRMQMDVPKMPFYMSYPMQNLYLTEMEYEKDMERMKELYPKEVKTILSYVEDAVLWRSSPKRFFGSVCCCSRRRPCPRRLRKGGNKGL